ncbi:MAG: hypothetical protein SVK08_03250 [Halobacteriota archaeon]|nr:hypothetical protein [Halobacteriota archaeon]
MSEINNMGDNVSMKLEYLKRASVGVASEGIVVSLLRDWGFGKVTVLQPDSNSIDEVKSHFKGVDVVIGSVNQEIVAKAAEELGAFYITSDVVTTILPDGIRFDELLIPKIELNPSLDAAIRSVQSFEAVKLLTGKADPVFAPDAIKLDLIDYSIKRVTLKKK